MRSDIGIKLVDFLKSGKGLILFLLMFIFLLLSSQNIFCQPHKEMFFEANKRYSDGDYQNAATMYEELSSEGIKSGNLFYNLGNSYFRTGKLGKALVNYERALRYLPDDEDLNANITFIQSAINASQPQDQLIWHEKIYELIKNMLTANGWFILSTALILISSSLLIVAIFKYSFKRTSYVLSAIIGFLCMISLFFFYKQYKDVISSEWGIIVSPRVEVRYSPSYAGAIAFELTEGVKAKIIRMEDNWVYVRLSRKNCGWIESECIEKI